MALSHIGPGTPVPLPNPAPGRRWLQHLSQHFHPLGPRRVITCAQPRSPLEPLRSLTRTSFSGVHAGPPWRWQFPQGVVAAVADRNRRFVALRITAL